MPTKIDYTPVYLHILKGTKCPILWRWILNLIYVSFYKDGSSLYLKGFVFIVFYWTISLIPLHYFIILGLSINYNWIKVSGFIEGFMSIERWVIFIMVEPEPYPDGGLLKHFPCINSTYLFYLPFYYLGLVLLIDFVWTKLIVYGNCSCSLLTSSAIDSIC